MDTQVKGGSNDIVHSISFKTYDDCDIKFEIIKKCFLDINKWGGLFENSTTFNLRNSEGTKKDSFVEKGDYVSILIPGPKNSIGLGYDWIRVCNLSQEISGRQESLTMVFQPSSHPITKKNTAHFFSEAARNYFSIVKRDHQIKVEVHGRNEVVNYSNLPLRDKIRNLLIAHTSILGFSKINWEIWARNILNDDFLEKCLTEN